MIKLGDLFDLKYGQSLELNRLKVNPNGINFVSRTARNNGVSSKVEKVEEITPLAAGTLTVALGGSVLETFLQTEPYYTGFHVYCLTPKMEMTTAQKLYYCACIRANKYRYNFGRQANRTLREILLPVLSDIPAWVNQVNTNQYDGADAQVIQQNVPELKSFKWKPFQISTLFDIKKGKRLTKANMTAGNTPYIGATDSNNGVTASIGQPPIHEGNTLSVAYNGSVAETFYQSEAFWATDDVNVLYPKFTMTPFIALFFAAVIRQEKYRYNYGRKWHLERMMETMIKLPAVPNGEPDFKSMEHYIQTLRYSGSI